MLLPIIAIVVGLLLLIWSADYFIDHAASLANHLGMSPLLIGVLIIGFGTSAPEMIVSALSALNHSPGIALGNAYGSNITNIALILGISAMIKPIMVNPSALKKELPALVVVTFLSLCLVYDGLISHIDAWILLAIFFMYMGWTIWQDSKQGKTEEIEEVEKLAENPPHSLAKVLLLMSLGLLVLMGSSQLLVWGAVEIAAYLGVSDLIIGLTIVAIGTSLPELAASIAAARKGEVDLAVGNIIGSNLFNTLAVVGIAGAISPIQTSAEILTRDMPVMVALTLSLFVFGYSFRHKIGKISRLEGLSLVLVYIGYNGYLIHSSL